MMIDTISDMLTRIRNAQERNTEYVEFPHSKKNEAIAKVLKDNDYITDVKAFKYDDKKFKGLRVTLKYDDEEKPAIQRLERISKSSLRVYKKSQDIKPVLGGIGIYVVSTSRGIMSSREATKKKLGGEIICKVY